MKRSSTVRIIFTVITFISDFTEAYRNPAHHRSPHVQYDYRNYHPSQHGSGHFGSLNRSLIPWEAYHHPLDGPTTLNSESNTCSTTGHKSGGFWLPNIAHQGTSPFLSDSAEYVIYRNVKDFGAKGDGSTDDSAAFNAAITRMLPPNSRNELNH
jgi:glucan 1,3-beta-glucosidase